MIRSSAFQKYLQDPIVTMRNDRYCLPVKAEYRGSVPGLGIDYDVLLCPLVTAWYLLTELGSIAENAGALGAPMPQFLMRAIAALRAGISDRGGGDGDGGGAA